MDRNTVLELIPAYVLDALDVEERQAVESLLETDREARQLLAEYQIIADTLVISVPMRTAPSTTRSGLQQKLAQRRSNHTSVNQSTPTEVPEKAKGRPLIRLWLGVGVAAAVFILFIFGFVVIQQFAPESTPTAEERIAYNRELYYSLVEEGNSQRLYIDPVMEGVQGDLVISDDGERIILRLAELPPLDETQAYQLWALDDVDLHSIGLYHWADGHGPYYVRVRLERPITAYERFGMSIEPRDGSPLGNAPTGSQVWGLQLASSQ